MFEVKCPQCDKNVEFFKDDTTRKCNHCGHRFINPEMDFGCAAYCKYAEQCIGDLPPELLAQKENLFKDRVAIEMKRYFKTEFKQIGHAMRVARYAERIGKRERGNLAVILSAAYLHDIGIIEAKQKHGSSGWDYHEGEGPAVARSIMSKLDAGDELIDEVCDIIEHHHHPRDEETINFKVFYDADMIANLEETQEKESADREKLMQIIASFLTESGREEAQKVLLDIAP
ncbi:HD domain-containing protein [Thermodesulfobacteriota bacterium]